MRSLPRTILHWIDWKERSALPVSLQGPRPRVVIVGAGFGGLNAAKALRGAPVDVTLVDRNNYHQFQPLLYQVATAGLDPGEIAHGVRGIFRDAHNVHFRLATVEDVNRGHRRILLRDGEMLEYDYLILAAGAVSSYFGIEGARAHSLPLKHLTEALALRDHVLQQFEQAEQEATVPDRSGSLTFAIVGGGPTGVELAGALTELFAIMQRDYRDLDTRRARVVLIEREEQLLPGYAEELGRYAGRMLARRGVDVWTGQAVARVEDGVVCLAGGQHLPVQSLIWAAGVEAAPLARQVGSEQERGGRLRVCPSLNLFDTPEVFAIGDLAAAADEHGALYPQLAPVAIQEGRHAARQILRHLRGEPLEPFRYHDRGKMATIGRNAAVASFPSGLHLTGFLAWVAWLFIHLVELIGFRNRANVLINWMYNYLTYDRQARLILDLVPAANVRSAGEVLNGRQPREQQTAVTQEPRPDET